MPGGGDQGDITEPGSAYSSAFFKFAGFRQDKENYGIVRGGMGGDQRGMGGRLSSGPDVLFLCVMDGGVRGPRTPPPSACLGVGGAAVVHPYKILSKS